MTKVTIERALIERARQTLVRLDPFTHDFAKTLLRELEEDIAAALAEPAVEPVVWHLSSNGLPPVGAQVIGGHFYVDPWLKDKTPVFSWGLCRVLETTDPEFKCGKQWHTFGPSHNDITHWCWPPAPPSNGNTSPPAEPATVPLLSDEEILQLTPLWFKKYTDGVLLGHARAIEQLVRRKAGL